MPSQQHEHVELQPQGNGGNIQTTGQDPRNNNPPSDPLPIKSGYGTTDHQSVEFSTPLMATVQMGRPIYDDSCPNQTVRQTFVTQGYKDWPFAIAFVLQLIVVIGVAISNGARGEARFNSDRGGRPYAAFFFITALTATFLCFLAMVVMRVSPRGFIWLANVLCILMWLGLGGFFLIRGALQYYVSGVVFLICGVLHGLWLFFVRRRIPFAAVLLSYSIRTVTKYWGTLVMSVVTIPLVIAFFFTWAAMAFPIFYTLDPYDDRIYCWYSNSTGRNCITVQPRPMTSLSVGSLYALSGLFLLLFYWSTQVITNVVHVTASGTVATWFFAGNDQMPRNPSWLSAKRAMTTSFGSICFGSLLVAILKLIHTILRSQRGRAGFLGCVALCLIGFIERLLQYFNVYAFTHVAIYGMGYIDAAKATWAMISQCGWSAVFNDNLVEPVLMLTSFINSLFLGLILGAVSGSAVTGLMCFLVSYVIHTGILQPSVPPGASGCLC